MGMNFEACKQSFETMVGQLETSTRVRFVVWLDERLAEYKVRGFMNFNSELLVPSWLRNYSKFVKKFSVVEERKIPSSHSYSLDTPASHNNISTTYQLSEVEEVPKDEVLSEESDVVKVKSEPQESDPGSDVIMVVPEPVEDDNYEEVPKATTYRTPHYSIQQRPMKSLRPQHRFAPKNSYAAAVAARKRRLKPLSQQHTQHRLTETIVFPSQQTTHTDLMSRGESIYSAGEYSQDYTVTTVPPTSTSAMSDPLTYSNEHSFIQFPGEGDVGVKSELYDTGGDSSVSFNEASLSEEQLHNLSYDSSYTEGGGTQQAGSSGMQESWRLVECKYCLKPSLKVNTTNDAAMESGDKNLYSCDSCKLKFSPTLEQNRQLTTFRSKKLYECGFCGMTFTSNTTLRRHERIHTGERPFICQYCDGAFNRRFSLVRHIKTQHAIHH